ncbi:MAG: helix-turn-helix domain-containing protein, partial [Rhodoferax sp.]|nr:helix-turn-helix domain-containing protein [Rhodoferax sp.]
MAAQPTPSCDASCPVQRAAQVLDGKWTILVLRDLMGGTKRYSELQRSLVGISPRLLADRLKALEAQGLLTRTAFATVPPTTEYSLTTQGQTLLPVVQALADFGTTVLARERAEATKATSPAHATTV